MWSDIRFSYGVAWRFAPAFPLIFLLPPGVEFLQHVIEWRLGVFDSLVQAEALANDPVRLGFGYVKLASLLIVGLWISRFLHSGDRRVAGAVTPGLLAAFLPVLVLSLAWEAAQMALGPVLSAAALGQAGAIAAGVGVFLAGSIFQVLMAGWRVGVPLRDRRAGLPASIRNGLRILPVGLPLYLVIFLPLLVLHTAMNVAMALVGPGAILWGLFVVDALLVGFIATALWGAYAVLYRRGLKRAGLEPPAI